MKLGTSLLVSFEYFWMSYGTGDFSKITFGSFEIDKILFIIAFKVNPIQAKLFYSLKVREGGL